MAMAAAAAAAPCGLPLRPASCGLPPHFDAQGSGWRPRKSSRGNMGQAKREKERAEIRKLKEELDEMERKKEELVARGKVLMQSIGEAPPCRDSLECPRAGCTKPAWRRKPGDFCGESCRDAAGRGAGAGRDRAARSNSPARAALPRDTLPRDFLVRCCLCHVRALCMLSTPADVASSRPTVKCNSTRALS